MICLVDNEMPLDTSEKDQLTLKATATSATQAAEAQKDLELS